MKYNLCCLKQLFLLLLFHNQNAFALKLPDDINQHKYTLEKRYASVPVNEEEQNFIRFLQSNMKCSWSQYADRQRDCEISFRGLLLTIVDVDDNPYFIIKSIGQHQSVTTRFGEKCVTVQLWDEKPVKEVILRDDGIIANVTNNQEFWQSCQR